MEVSLKAHIRVWNSVSLHTQAVIGMNDFELAVCCLSFSKADGGSLLVAVDEAPDHIISVWDWQKGENGSKITETKVIQSLSAVLYKLTKQVYKIVFSGHDHSCRISSVGTQHYSDVRQVAYSVLDVGRGRHFVQTDGGVRVPRQTEIRHQRGVSTIGRDHHRRLERKLDGVGPRHQHRVENDQKRARRRHFFHLRLEGRQRHHGGRQRQPHRSVRLQFKPNWCN